MLQPMHPVNLTIVCSKASLRCHLEILGDEIRIQTPCVTELYCDLSGVHIRAAANNYFNNRLIGRLFLQLVNESFLP